MSSTIRQLRDQLFCGNEMARNFALQELACAGAEGVSMLRQALRCSDKAIGLCVARTLAEMDIPEHFEIMVETLGSPNLLIAELAARKLEMYGEQAVAPLLAALPDCHAFVQVGIVATLERIGSRNAVEPLMAVLRKTEYSTLQHMIIQALGSLGDPIALDLVRSFSDNPDYYVRERTQIAMRQLSANSLDSSKR